MCRSVGGLNEAAQSSSAVRNTNECVVNGAVADPVNWSQLSPICGSSEKVIAIVASGLRKCALIKLISASPSTVADIDVLALGASIMTRIQASLALEAAIRVDVDTTLPWPWEPLATTWSIVVEAAALRTGRALWGTGALAATIFERSTREEEAAGA